MAKANLTTEIRDYEFFKTDILTPEDYVKICEEYDDIDGYQTSLIMKAKNLVRFLKRFIKRESVLLTYF